MIQNKKTLETILCAIQKIRPKEFQNYDIGRAMAYPIIYYEKRSIIYEWKAVLALIIKEYYAFDRIGDNGIILLYSSSYTKRKDHREKFEKIAKIIQSSSVISSHKNRGINFNNLIKLHKIAKWHMQMRSLDVDIPKQLKRYIVYWLYGFYCELDEIKRLEKKLKIPAHTFASYCDVMPSDSILIQYFNNTKRNTVTFQHGSFNIKTLNGEIVYKYSMSKYFLCYGEYTRNQAIQIGINADKMIPVGPPEMIGQTITYEMQSVCTKKFGLILSFFEQKDENIELLKYALEFARDKGYRCMIRPHPSLDIKEYEEYMDFNNMFISPTAQNMDDFIKDLEFGIMGTTTVFSTFVTKLIPVFRYLHDWDKDLYEGIDWCLFRNKEELICLYNKMENDKAWLYKNLVSTRNCLIGKEDISKKYKLFFETLISK